MKLTPTTYRWLLSLWPPYLGAGVRIDEVAANWREIKVSMRLRWYNRNYKAVHFGGSLYSMCDPHLMLMLAHLLGKDYVVWDRAASIEYLSPGRSKVSARFVVTDEELATIRAATASGEKYLPEFTVDVVNEVGEVVARVTKVVYVRRKRQDNALITR